MRRFTSVSTPSQEHLTIAKPERRAEVLLDAFSFALLSCSFLQER
jgi:hypothetical protein